MADLSIKFFGRDVTFREDETGLLLADLGPSLRLRWHAEELALVVGSFRVSPVSGGNGDIQRAAEILEGIFRPLATLFEQPEAVHTGPVPMALHCPKCSFEHIDTAEDCGAGAVHCCLGCGEEWQPCDFETVGVEEPEEGEAEISYFDGGHDGPGWYYWDSECQDEGAVGAFESFEAAARHAAVSYPRVLPPQIARPA